MMRRFCRDAVDALALPPAPDAADRQPSFNMLHREVEEDGLDKALAELGIGCIPFHPLAQGVLTNKYLGGVPQDSRAALGGFLKAEELTEGLMAKVRALNDLAAARGQTLAQMAVAWVLSRGVTSALIGASRPSQIVDCVGALQRLDFSAEELAQIDAICEAP